MSAIHPLHDSIGEQKNQILVVVDENGNRIGTNTRQACHQGKGIPHLAFLAFVQTPKGIVLTKRSDKKSLWPGYWDASVVSHVLHGETPEQAAQRRGREELGIDSLFRDIGAFYYREPYGENSENEYCHILIGKTEEKVVYNPVEISEIEYIPTETFISKIRGRFHVAPWLSLALQHLDVASFS